MMRTRCRQFVARLSSSYFSYRNSFSSSLWSARDGLSVDRTVNASPRGELVSGVSPSRRAGASDTLVQGVQNGRGYMVGNGAMTMKAAVLWEPNSPMRMELLQIPRPRAGEVLVKTKACGVCHTDLHVMKKETLFPTPCVLGHEISGHVVEHGTNTDVATIRRLPVGSRVVGAFIMPCGGCFFCVKGHEDLCETFFEMNRLKGTLYDGETRLFLAGTGRPLLMYSMGGLAEYCVMPATALTTLPESLPFEESSILGCAVFTAYGAMRNAADMRAGESVAVIGVGGVGSSCVQIARAFGGSHVIAVDVNDEKLSKARALGATHSINALEQNVPERLKEITGGRGVDIAVEALGKPATFNQAVLGVRDGGRAVMVGIAPAGVTADVDITRIVRRQIRIIGSYGARTRQDLPAVVKLAEGGYLDLSATVTLKTPLYNASATYESLNAGKIVGRAIVTMD